MKSPSPSNPEPRHHRSGNQPPSAAPHELAAQRERVQEQARAQEQAFDALLSEAVGKIDPPDLTQAILHQLGVAETAEPQLVFARSRTSARDLQQGAFDGEQAGFCVLEGEDQGGTAGGDKSNGFRLIEPAEINRPRHASRSANRRRVLLAAGFVAAVATVWLVIVGRWSPEEVTSPRSLADQSLADQTGADQTGADQETVSRDSAKRPGEDLAGIVDPAEEISPLREPGFAHPRGIPLTLDPSLEEGRMAERSAIDRPGTTVAAGEVPSIRLVSQRVDSDLGEYWSSIGIRPFPERAAESITDHLKVRLGTEMASAALGDAERIRHEIAKPGRAAQIAARWLAAITEGGSSRLSDEPRQRLIDELSECFQGKRRLDETFARWFGTDLERASDWYSAVSVGGQPAMLRRLASLSMDVDLRCIRCHDSFVEGSGRQRDYWAFAALFRRDLQRQSAGGYVVQERSESGKDVFYDLLDGRRRLAEPGVPDDWVSSASPATSLPQWAANLRGREELARGIVNSLWTLVHGRPLDGSAIDPITAPRDRALETLERRLAEDLIASRFDVGRTLALIIDAPATSRAVPSEVQDGPLLAAPLPVRQSVGAFAAAVPPQPQRSTAQRLDLALRSIGKKLDSLTESSTLLAQVGEQDPQGAKGPQAEVGRSGRQTLEKPNGREIQLDFPTGAEGPPVHWLASLKDLDDRISHLAFLAGRSEVPESVLEAAELMQDAGIAEDLLLHRVWWLLKP